MDFVEDFFDEVVYLLLVGEFPGHAGVGGNGPDEDAEVAGYLDVVQGALAQETVGQGAQEGDFAFAVPAAGGQAGQGGASNGGKGQRAAAGPPASTASTAPDGAGFLPRRMAAGIRFYAGYGGAGSLPRRLAAGIRFYAGIRRSGFSSATVGRGHPLLRRVRRSGFSSATVGRGHPLLRRVWRSGFSSAALGHGHPRGGRAGGAGQPPLEQAPRRGAGGRGRGDLTWVCCEVWVRASGLGNL